MPLPRGSRQPVTSQYRFEGLVCLPMTSAETSVDMAPLVNLPAAQGCILTPSASREPSQQIFCLSLSISESVSRSSLIPAKELLPELCYFTLA